MPSGSEPDRSQYNIRENQGATIVFDREFCRLGSTCNDSDDRVFCCRKEIQKPISFVLRSSSSSLMVGTGGKSAVNCTLRRVGVKLLFETCLLRADWSSAGNESPLDMLRIVSQLGPGVIASTVINSRQPYLRQFHYSSSYM